jgi:hypothetical protein
MFFLLEEGEEVGVGLLSSSFFFRREEHAGKQTASPVPNVK